MFGAYTQVFHPVEIRSPHFEANWSTFVWVFTFNSIFMVRLFCFVFELRINITKLHKFKVAEDLLETFSWKALTIISLLVTLVIKEYRYVGYKFYESRSNDSLSYGYHPRFIPSYHFWEERVVKNWYKKLLLAIEWRSPNFIKCFYFFIRC